MDEAVLYYFLTDFEENQPSSSPAGIADSDTIWWFGHPLDGLVHIGPRTGIDNRFSGVAS
ncbi:hypothetical protein C6A85_13190 [Mycobacterium sp. ITM-2017-0098]|nr:hypothetical protein C6A85_13190 [Mycobacterium sp. ITM-2017-0098]